VIVRDRSSPGLMARRTAARHASLTAPWSSPVLLDSCRPSGRGRRVKTRKATACRLALTRRTRPTHSGSGEYVILLVELHQRARPCRLTHRQRRNVPDLGMAVR
jgi:hypothetical protein